METELKMLREDHAQMLHKSKCLLVDAKRVFAQAKRTEEGLLKSEQQCNIQKFAKNSKKFIGQDCGICMATFEKKGETEGRVLVKACGHVFHAGCFKMWAQLKTTCPFCRGEIEPSVDNIKLPEVVTQMISWSDVTLTNVSAI